MNGLQCMTCLAQGGVQTARLVLVSMNVELHAQAYAHAHCAVWASACALLLASTDTSAFIQPASSPACTPQTPLPHPLAHLAPQEEFSLERKMHMLDRLSWSEMFENFLANKFTAAKRFGLEGCETLVPGMKAMIDLSADLGVQSICIGMPHRGAGPPLPGWPGR